MPASSKRWWPSTTMGTIRVQSLLPILLITSLMIHLLKLCHARASPSFPVLPVIKSRAEPSVVEPSLKRRATLEEPVHALVRRLLPERYHDHFVFKLDPELVPASMTNIHDTFRVSSNDGNTMIEGATLAGLGAGLNYYLRSVCQVEMSWSGDRLNDMPAVPPTITEPTGVIRASFVPWRYYMNVVTFGYSFAFWDWKRWERELDWMFLNGINMALAMVGQEYIFRQMYEDLGLTREELNGFFAGPAFMPWQRMGNIQGSWVLTNDTQFKHDWIDSQWDLQQLILGRMHEFNITAILPSFNGFVPHELVSKYPNVKFDRASQWGELPDPYSKVYFVPSTESLFANLTQQFVHLQRSMYNERGISYQGEKNYYLLDLYNELYPVCMQPQCLREISSGVLKALKNADPKAVWTMQAWFLLRHDIWKPDGVRAFFDGILSVNQGRDVFMIDLYSDVAPLWNDTRGFFGIDWGWSMLNNFGGGQGLYGTLPTLLTEPFAGYRQPARSMRGMGLTMEGINNNEYLYQLVLDIPWESIEAMAPPTQVDSAHSTSYDNRQKLNQLPLDGQKHLEEYLKRRYGPGQTSKAMIDAWTTLSKTVWDCRTGQMSQSKSKLEATPALDMFRPGFLTTDFWYNETEVVQAWSQLVQSTETERSKKRRGHGIIQNAIERVLRAAGGRPFPDPQQSDVQTIFLASPGEQEESNRSDETSLSGTIGSFTALPNGENSSLSRSSLNSPSNVIMSHPSNEEDLPLNVSSFRYDLVDVTREVMAAIVIPGLHKELVDAYTAKDLELTRFIGGLLLDAILDTDSILATHSHFMLGPWIHDARISARTANSTSSKTVTNPAQPERGTAYMCQYADYLEQNARTLITWWANEGQVGLSDYASKHWAGLVKDFYYPRWKIFVSHLVQAVESGAALDNNTFKLESLRNETEWQKQRTSLGNVCRSPEEGLQGEVAGRNYPSDATRDTIEVAQDLWDRWAHAARRLALKSRNRNVKYPS